MANAANGATFCTYCNQPRTRQYSGNKYEQNFHVLLLTFDSTGVESREGTPAPARIWLGPGLRESLRMLPRVVACKHRHDTENSVNVAICKPFITTTLNMHDNKTRHDLFALVGLYVQTTAAQGFYQSGLLHVKLQQQVFQLTVSSSRVSSSPAAQKRTTMSKLAPPPPLLLHNKHTHC